MAGIKEFLQDNCRGQENAVTSKILEDIFGCKGSDIRHTVNDLRRSGVPICSGRNGYYYATRKNEITATIAHLEGRMAKIKAAQSGLLNSLSEKAQTR